ncbi:MAG: glycosyltransferase family 2 protein [Lewinellaceae bacterium]|nr:glycosyltransferase family 2 protein [Saprospiraceae bacterium]MCB9304989.1 glycosyltransferase family 2 protein [Lewinellaceae bacterium]
MRPPLVSIISVNYNQAEATCEMLDSIRAQEYGRVEVIVVDNGSRYDAGGDFRRRFPGLKYIRSEKNLGFAGGNRLGLSLATGDFLFFLNNDAELTEGCIERLVSLFDQVPGLGAASPLICYPAAVGEPARIQYAGMTRVHPLTGRNRVSGHGETDEGQYAVPGETAYAHGAAMMVSQEMIDRVGPMSEDFFLYYEELDWCAQMRRAGYSVWVEPRARVIHKESLATGKLGALKTYYLHRNRILFMRRNYNGWRLAVFIIFLMLITVPKNSLLYLFRGERSNLDAFLLGVFWNIFPGQNNAFEMQRKRTDLPPGEARGSYIFNQHST